MIYDSTKISTELLTYLRRGGFTYFRPQDVANYVAIGQVHVRMTHGDCEKTYVFKTRDPEMLAGQCTPGHDEQPPADFWDEVEAMGLEFASITTANSTVQVVRRRDPSLASPY